MQVEVSKNELAGALTALGKLICRTSPVEAYRSVQIVGKENCLHFRTAGSEESIEFKMQANITEDFAVVVDFELFRQAVRGSRNKCLVFEYADGVFAVDGLRMATVNCEFPKMPEVPAEGTKVEILPSTFVDLLNTAAPIVNRDDYRKVLQGINLSRDGITVSNGKELLNVPVQMEVESLTIPFPLALIATKATGMSKLAYWTDGVSVFFQITVADWTWTSKTVAGTYPNWKVVVPDQKNLTHRVEFAADQGTPLKNWLKTVPEDLPYTAMELGMANSETLSVKSLKGMTLNLPAQFTNFCDYLADAMEEENLPKFQKTMEVFFAGIAYDVHHKDEANFQNIFYAIFKLLGYNIHAESKTCDGRIDAILETDQHIYLFEFKLNKDNSALAQIKEKEYFKPYLLSPKKITLVGANFDTETGKLSDWKNEEVAH